MQKAEPTNARDIRIRIADSEGGYGLAGCII